MANTLEIETLIKNGGKTLGIEQVQEESQRAIAALELAALNKDRIDRRVAHQRPLPFPQSLYEFRKKAGGVQRELTAPLDFSSLPQGGSPTILSGLGAVAGTVAFGPVGTAVGVFMGAALGIVVDQLRAYREAQSPVAV